MSTSRSIILPRAHAKLKPVPEPPVQRRKLDSMNSCQFHKSSRDAIAVQSIENVTTAHSIHIARSKSRYRSEEDAVTTAFHSHGTKAGIGVRKRR